MDAILMVGIVCPFLPLFCSFSFSTYSTFGPLLFPVPLFSRMSQGWGNHFSLSTKRHTLLLYTFATECYPEVIQYLIYFAVASISNGLFFSSLGDRSCTLGRQIQAILSITKCKQILFWSLLFKLTDMMYFTIINFWTNCFYSFYDLVKLGSCEEVSESGGRTWS